MGSKSYTLAYKISWVLILVFVFWRPFVSSHAFKIADICITTALAAGSALYFLLSHKRKKLSIANADILILLFALSIVISIVQSPRVIKSIDASLSYIPLLIIFYLIKLTNPEERKALTLIVIGSAVAVSLYSLRAFFVVSPYALQYLARAEIDFPFAEGFLSYRRAFPPFVLPSLLAGYLVMVLPITFQHTLLTAKTQKSPHAKLIIFCLATATCLMAITLFLTKSIGGLISLFGSLGIFFMVRRRFNKKNLLTLFILIVIICAVIFVRAKGTAEYSRPLFSLQKRLGYAQDTLRIIKQHPFRGVGVGNFTLRETRFSHNSYLQIWAEMGILGIISYLAVVSYFLARLFRELTLKRIKYISSFAIAAIAFLIHNLIDFSFFVPQVSFLWWILFALVAGNGTTEVNDRPLLEE